MLDERNTTSRFAIHYVFVLPDFRYGAGTSVLGLAQSLVRLGQRCSLIGQNALEESKCGSEVIGTSVPNLRVTEFVAFFRLVRTLRILRRGSKRPIAVTGGLWHSIPVIVASRLAGVPVIAFERGAIAPRLENLGGGFRRQIGTLLISAVYALPCAIFFNSKGSLGEFRDSFPRVGIPMHHLYSGVDVKALKIEMSHKTFDDQIALERPRGITALFVGRLVPAKNLSWLISMLQSCASRPTHLQVVGDGPLRAALELQARQAELRNPNIRFTFTGVQSADDVRLAMTRTDVLLLSSKWEGLPRVLLEAALYGTPIVSLDTRHGPAEILAYYRYGIIVKGQDPASYWQAVLAASRYRAEGTSPADPQDGADSPFSSFDAIASRFIGLTSQLQC